MSLRPGLLCGGVVCVCVCVCVLAHGFLSMPVHCHCPSSEHPGGLARVAQALAGWANSGLGTDPQLSGL